MARTISHSVAALTREILFLPLEHKIHIFSPPCNIVYISGYSFKILFSKIFLQTLVSFILVQLAVTQVTFKKSTFRGFICSVNDICHLLPSNVTRLTSEPALNPYFSFAQNIFPQADGERALQAAVNNNTVDC